MTRKKSHSRSRSTSSAATAASSTRSLPISAAARIITHDPETSLYRIRWKGHSAADDSWRSREELAHTDLLANFERQQIPVNERGERALAIDPQWKKKRAHRRQTKSVSFCEEVRMVCPGKVGEEWEVGVVGLRC